MTFDLNCHLKSINMSFKELGLKESILTAIRTKGYEKPSIIQEKAIPQILAGRDLLASSQTGSGKTAGFTLPILQLLSNKQVSKKRNIRALILTPTRELAAQVSSNVETYGANLHLRSTVIFGGVNQNPQVRAIRNGVDLLVATPGRLLDLHNQRLLSLANVEILVLDEADRMLDMGFVRDIRKIMSLLPSKRQTLLFSATFSDEIKKLTKEFLHNPVSVEATPENSTVDKINQTAYRVDKKHKSDAIIDLIAGGKWQQVLVFTRTKHAANRLTEKMNKCDVSALAIHGNKTQSARVKALSGLHNKTIRVLVATDIAARGLDIPLLPHVINYELPNVAEDYVHRIGRTGRAGAKGEAISLVSVDEIDYLKNIEKLIGQELPLQMIEGYEPSDKPGDVSKPAAQKKSNFNRRRNNKNRNFKRKPKRNNSK